MSIYRLLLSLLFLTSKHLVNGQCLSRDYGNGGTVCVCNSNQCDIIETPEEVPSSQYLTYTSNKYGLRFEKNIGKFVNYGSTKNQILIDSSVKYQEIFGFGGAFTDSTGLNINSLDEDLQDKLLRSYFSEEGIEYSIGRVPIGGTDFSTHAYSYNDGLPDMELRNFSLAAEDYNLKIRHIKKASDLTSGNLWLFGSAWTAPKWMKTNGEYNGYGFLRPEMYQVWANYFLKFLDSYKEEGISFWGITTGNEPNTVNLPVKINSVGWLPVDLGKWIQGNLGPTLRTSNHSDIKIIIFDDQRMYLPTHVVAALSSNLASQYVDGIGVHWYTKDLAPPILLSATHQLLPTKFILSTEACSGFAYGDVAVVLGSWQRGEDYSTDIIEELSNWVVGWIDWNMVLDEDGGPTYIDNTVDSPIIVNATGGEFYKQPMYYHFGHFSKFVKRGSFRISSTSDLNENVMVIAFQRPDNGTVVVLLNKDDKTIPVSIVDSTRGTASLKLSKKSITTILYW